MKKNIINIKCAVCGKVTPHYLADGSYKCIYCENVDKVIPVKEIVFTPDEDFIEPDSEEVESN